MASSAPVDTVIQQAKSLAESGSWDEAIQLLAETNRREQNGRIERLLVMLRHKAFDELPRPAVASPWPKHTTDHFPDTTTVPEIPASDLSADLVSSAIHHHGSIIIRGLFDAPACEQVRNAIDGAFAGMEAVAGQKEFDPTPWYAHFNAQRKKGYRFGGAERQFVTFGAGVLAVDSPRALFRYLECLEAVGFGDFLRDYLGERPAFSAKKSTFRRTPPDAKVGWHQDGGYFCAEVRALNLWAAFSPCGVDAPSIDIFAKRFDDYVEPGDSVPDWAKGAIGDDSVARRGLEHVVRPEFEPGDALLFDELALHRTGVDESMTKSRYAVEMWFFAPSMFPRDQVPLYL